MIEPLPARKSYGDATLTKPRDHPGVFLLELHRGKDNKISADFWLQSIKAPLLDVEREVIAARRGLLSPAPTSSDGWTAPKEPNAYALVTCGSQQMNRFYSYGFELAAVRTIDGFFQHVFRPVLAHLLTFPIPTVCAVNGHAYAAGCLLAMVHDHRIMKDNEAKGRAQLCMSEAEFGAHIPAGTCSLIRERFHSPRDAFRCIVQAHKFGPREALASGLVDRLVSEAQTVPASLDYALSLSKLAVPASQTNLKAGLYRSVLAAMAESDPLTSPTETENHRGRVLGLALDKPGVPGGKAKL